MQGTQRCYRGVSGGRLETALTRYVLKIKLISSFLMTLLNKRTSVSEAESAVTMKSSDRSDLLQKCLFGQPNHLSHWLLASSICIW